MQHHVSGDGNFHSLSFNSFCLTCLFQFQGILKPSYNSVDMAEVELVDDQGEARDFNQKLHDVSFYHLSVL